MKFLCLISAEKLIEQMSDDEATRHYAEYRELIDRWQKSGHYVAGHRLLPPSTAVTLRVRDGKTHSTDGPFAETKEQLGGFILLEAQDMEEAMRLAAQIPGAKQGCVEVRPIADDSQTREAMRQL